MSEFGEVSPAYMEDSWIPVATGYATQRGYSFSDGSLANLTSFLGSSAANLRASETTADPDKLAKDIKHLVELMIEARTAEDPTATVLQEWTLSQAIVKFCPLFPFC